MCTWGCVSRPAENSHREILLPRLPAFLPPIVLLLLSPSLSRVSHQHVPPPVQGQVVGPGEAAVTVCALEGLDPRVFPVVPRQLIGPRKLPRAAVPRAFVWLFPCMRPPVGF